MMQVTVRALLGKLQTIAHLAKRIMELCQTDPPVEVRR